MKSLTFSRAALAVLGLAGAPAAVRLTATEVDVSSVERVAPAQPMIPARLFRLTDFGAKGDGATLNTDAFKKAVAAVDQAGGGRLVVPKGVFRTLPFTLCSKLDLHLEEGAVIEAPDTFAGYGLPEPSSFKTQAEIDAQVKTPKPLISGRGLTDVAITGPGTIEGHGELWWAWSERASRAHPGRLIYKRFNMVTFDDCQRLLVSDVTLRHSPKFYLVPKRVTDLTIERVKVRAPFDAPNTDAIDPGPVTRGVIRDCDIDTGDDDICVKSGATDLLIENCTIKHGHGISIGSETITGVHGMLVRNCTFDGTDNGIRIKSMIGAGGLVENVRYTGITMKDVDNAIVLDLAYTDNNRPDFKGDPTRIPAIRDILIDHVTITGSKRAGRIVGLPSSRITGITLRDVSINAEKDLVIQDADAPELDRVTRDIRAGVAPKKTGYLE